MKQRMLSLLILLLMGIPVWGQYAGFSMGPAFAFTRYTSFSYFADSYNRFHKSELSEPLGNFRFAGGKYFGFSMGDGGAGMDLSYSNLRHTAEAVFTTGEKRVFDLRLGYFDILLNVGGGNDGAGVWATAGFCTGRMNLYSYTEYPDGTYNYSLEQILNGQYTGFYIAGILGLKAQIPFSESFALQLRAEKLFKQTNYLGFQLHDKDNGRSNTAPHTDAIPTDYYHYNDIIATQGMLPEQYFVLPDLSGVRFSIALTILLNN